MITIFNYHQKINNLIKIITMQKFRKLDLFKKVPKDLSEGTDLGGLVSIVAGILIVYFVVS